MNKICVYAICKNESQFVEKWYNSMSEADCVVVLDTGSTDDTVKKFKKLGVKIEQKIITPWRFDIARNESMKLAPDDCNILVCTDLDEVFEHGWAKELREKWIDGKHKNCWYKFVWNHYPDGSDGHVFWYNKIHTRDYVWKYPVHEVLVGKKECKNKLDKMEELIIEEGIRLHHYPVDKESRNTYLPLIKMRLDEFPDETYSHIYLSRQYLLESHFKECIECVDNMLKKFGEDIIPIEKAAVLLYKGDSYKYLGDTNKAIESYKQGIESDQTFRENYIALAETIMGLKKNDKKDEEAKNSYAFSILTEALQKTYQHFSWLERDNSYTSKIFDLLSLSSYYSGNKKMSLLYAFKASYMDPNNERLKNNIESIMNNMSEKDYA